MVILALAIPAVAAPRSAPQATSTSTISYQGRLADSAGTPLTGYYNLEFRIYDVPTGGAPLREEFWTGGNSVQVSDGLFNVMLGSISNTLASAIEGHDELYLGITVGTDSEMAPRVQLGSVPFSMQAMTVADGSITTAKIADGAVTQAKLGPDVSLEPPDGSITTEKIADGAVTTAKLNVDNGLAVAGPLTVSGAGPQITIGGWGPNGVRFLDDSGPTGVDLHYRTSPDELRVERTSDGATLLLLARDSGNLHIAGSFSAGGSKSAVVGTVHYGQRKLYTPESPEVRFFDEGLAHLEDGRAHVNLDPIFLETIEGEYLVHVTPYGNTSLYVAEIGQDYFVVRARDGDPNVAFAWRLSAYRKGYEGVRLEEVAQEGVEIP